jgi:hypothetical protein
MNQDIHLGAWIGRRQAFAAVAGKSIASQAACLRFIRNHKLYQSQTKTWPEFCETHIGVSRAHADRLIRHLEEFGEDYFRLSELTRISPETYRAIAHHVTPGGIEFNGQIIPITPDYVPSLNMAVNALRPRKPVSHAAAFPALAGQLESCIKRLEVLPVLTVENKRRLAGLASRLHKIAL